MAVQQNIHAEHQNDGDDEFAHRADDGILIVVQHLIVQLPHTAASRRVHQHGHGAHGGEQHEGLAQRIEGTVVQDHARHGVHRAGLLGALFHIALRHLVDGGRVVAAVGGQVGHRQQHEDGKDDACHDGQHRIGDLAPLHGFLSGGGVVMRLIGDGGRFFSGLLLLQHGRPVHLAVQPAAEEVFLTAHGCPPLSALPQGRRAGGWSPPRACGVPRPDR